MLRKLTSEEIEEFASRRGVRRIAVENFLMTVTNNPTLEIAMLNLVMDASLYKWNSATLNAIRAGIYKSAGYTYYEG